MSERVSVTSAEFIRNIGYWQNEALRRPISITHHGRERLVLTTPDGVAAFTADASLTRLRADADAVVENLEDGLLVFDADLRLTRCNVAAEALVGRSRDVLRGAAMPEVMPAPLGLLFQERLQRVARSRKPEQCEGVFGALHVSARIFPLSEGAAILLRNATEHQDHRMRLGVGDALCAATGHHPHAAAIKLDASGCIVGAHDGFHAWAGLRPEEAVGRRLVDLLPAPQRRQVAAAIESTLRDGSPHRALLTLADQDGQEVSGVLSLAPIQIDLRTQGAVAMWVRQETAAGLALAPDIDYAAEERAGANS